MRKLLKRCGRLLIAATIAGPLIACDNSEDLDDVSQFVTAGFVPESGCPVSPDTVALVEGMTSGPTVLVEVEARGVGTPISGIAMKIGYPADLARFVRCFDGGMLSAGDCLSSEPSTGEVFVSLSIQAPQVPRAGSGTVVALEFTMLRGGRGPIVLQGQNLGGGDATALLDGNGDPIQVQWCSGDLLGL